MTQDAFAEPAPRNKRAPADDPFARAGIERDQYGRPILPDPVTGEVVKWTRVTTMAGAIEDTFHLQKWSARMTAKGIALRDDLRALAAASDPNDADGKKDLQRAADEAKEHAGGSVGANLGTAVHSFIRRVVAGELMIGDVPASWRPDVEAWFGAMREACLEPMPEYAETLCVNRELVVAGSFDRPVRCKRTGRIYIEDDKTGLGELDYSQVKTSAQLAMYARADAYWRPSSVDAVGNMGYVKPLDVDKATAIVIHAPVMTGTATAQRVDIEFGWGVAQEAARVRNLRKRKPFSLYTPPAETPDAVTVEMVAACTTIEDVYALAKAAGALWTQAHVAAARLVRDKLLTHQ